MSLRSTILGSTKIQLHRSSRNNKSFVDKALIYKAIWTHNHLVRKHILNRLAKG